MKPTTLSIFELFEKERRYMVPLFQRPYVWNRERQWEPLWEDISSKASEVAQHTKQSSPLRKHFLGAVVLNQVPTFGLQVSAMEIIDGQQRLTTLQILLLAFRDFAQAHDLSKFSSTLNRLTENSCQLEEEHEQYKVWPTSTDQAVFETVATAKSPEAVNEKYPLTKIKFTRKYYPRPQLVDAYLFFYDAIKKYAQPETEDGVSITVPDAQISVDRLGALMNALTRFLELVIIELEERDDPQIIFETLNARGEPLLPFDLVRNFVFLDAARKHEDVNQLYENYWSDFDKPGGEAGDFWKAVERQGRSHRPRLDLFLFNYLTYRTAQEVPITHLFPEFRDWWNARALIVEDELKALQYSGRVFKSFYQPDPQSRLGVFASRLRALDTSTLYPLLLFLQSQEVSSIPPVELDGIITDLESYLIRRMICGLTTKNYNRTFLQLLRNLRTADHVNRAGVRKLLMALTGESGIWPTDDEFKQAWLNRPMYHLLSVPRIVMVLHAIDQHMETSKQEQVFFYGPLTVEHIMPQSPLPHDWPLVPFATVGDPNYDALIAQRNMLIHTFGNLTLLTQTLNSSISNGPFAKKRPEIAKQSKLRMNAYFQDLSNGDEWTVGSIVRRGTMLFEIARMVWPRPD